MMVWLGLVVEYPAIRLRCVGMDVLFVVCFMLVILDLGCRIEDRVSCIIVFSFSLPWYLPPTYLPTILYDTSLTDLAGTCWYLSTIIRTT